MVESKTANTNLVLLMSNNERDSRKFIVWDIEGTKPVEVLTNLEITRIGVENQKKVFEHPLEDGSVIADYEVLEPKRTTLQAYIALDDSSTLTELERLYVNGTRLRVRAENRVIENMVIASQPCEITSAVLDKTLYSISLKEAQFVSPQYVAMAGAKNKSNTSRVNSGIKQAQQVNKPQSWLDNLIFGNKKK